MDLDTAKEQRVRLQKELDTLGKLGETAAALSFTQMLIDMEISRLDPIIASDGSEVIVEVEEKSMVLRLSKDFSLKTISLAVEFKERLIAELHEIEKLHPAFPFTTLFIQRVIECMEEEIIAYRQRQYAESQLGLGANDQPEINNENALPEVEWMLVPRSSFYYDHLWNCIINAIKEVLEKNPQGASSEKVLNILRRNPSIQVEYDVRSFVRQKFFEAAYLNIEPAPSDQGTSGHQ